MDSNGVWLTAGQQTPSHTYQKMHELGFADGILREKTQSRSETISWVSIFSLGLLLPRMEEQRKKKSLSWDRNLSLASVKACGFKKLLSLEPPELQLYSPNQRSTFHGDGEDACASASWPNHRSFYLSIFVTHTPPSRGLAFEGMIHDVSPLSLIRPATCSSQRLLAGIGFV